MHDVKSKKLPQWANQNKYSGKALTNNNSQINIHIIQSSFILYNNKSNNVLIMK